MVSCVRVSENIGETNQPSVVKPGINDDIIQSGDTLNWVIKDAVLCMLRREDNNNLVALRRYLLTRFPQIPDVCRDAVIIATFTTAQKVALSYLDTLHEDATERNVWARNYLHKWSHGLSASEPPPRYVPSVKASKESPNVDRYSPVTNYLLTKDFPVSISSQKREFEKEFDRVTEQIVGEQTKAVVDTSTAGGHPVTETLVSVAKSLMNLPSSSNVQNQSEPNLAVECMATESSNVTAAQCSSLEGVVLSMPDLSEFAPVVTNGVVQPADVSLHSFYEGEPMEEGHATDSPIVDNFASLLHVENVSDNMLKEVNKPLLEMITPITSPALGDSEIEDAGDVAKESDYSSSSVSPVKSANISKHSKPVQVQKHVAKSPRKEKGLKSAKENVKSQRNLVKVTSVCKKVERDHKKKTHNTQHEKHDMLRKPKKLNESQQNLKEVASVGIRDQRISDFRIPLRQRMDNLCRPNNRYQRENNYYGRCVGLVRGYSPEYLSRHNEGPRPRPQSYSRAGYVPNLTLEQQAWLDHMPSNWFEQ